MPNNPYQDNARKLLKALDDPAKLASIRRDVAMTCLGLSIGLMAGRLVLWAAIAGAVGLWMLYRSEKKATPRLKLEKMVVGEETPPEM